MSVASPRRLLAVACILGAVLAGCPADPREAAKSKPVARVGDSKILESDLLAALSQHGTARVADPAARVRVAQAILDDMITERLMLLAAESAGITVRDEDVDREMRSRAEGYPLGTFQRLLVAEQLTLAEFRSKVRNRLVQDAFLRARLAQAPAITEEEVVSRYEEKVKNQEVGEQVRARQILVKTSEEATHILEQVRAKKMTFEAAAQRHSTSPDAEKGGDLGWFSKGDMPSVFDLCFNLDKGTISDVVISDYGFHLFQILDRREQHTETLESAREQIEQQIMREHQDAAYEALLAELRERTPVVVHEEPFQRIVASLPPAQATPAEEAPFQGGRSLDSLPDQPAGISQPGR